MINRGRRALVGLSQTSFNVAKGDSIDLDIVSPPLLCQGFGEPQYRSLPRRIGDLRRAAKRPTNR